MSYSVEATVTNDPEPWDPLSKPAKDLTSHAVENIIFDLIMAADLATLQQDRSDFIFWK